MSFTYPATATAQNQANGSAQAQLQVPLQVQTAGYTVTGHVTCADTQHPARFALVSLIPATGTSGGFDRGRRSSARTDLDGSFQITNVPVGDYFVTAALTGYVNDESAVVSALNASDPGSLHGIPTVHVAAGGASAEVSIQRGAVISGTAQWDDGTPAAGVQINAVSASSANATSTAASQFRGGIGSGSGTGNFAFFASTDDRGRFRLAGLAPGAYLVRASVQAPVRQQGDTRGFQRTMNIAVYAPNKVRRPDATAITLASGEERPDIAITLGLTQLHTVSGQVGAAGASVRSGNVVLVDQTDSTLNRVGYIGADGSFVVTYVPAGTYTLNVTASSQANAGFGRGGGGPSSGDSSGARFQRFQESVTVADGDLTGLTITVAPATSSQ